MKYERSDSYDQKFIRENLMGPSALKIIDEVTFEMKFKSGAKVLDLGCGKALTSIFLAKEFNLNVVAADLWIDPTENFERIKKMNLENQILPIRVEAHELPFAREYFDYVFCVDAFPYFGCERGYLSERLAPFVKPGGEIIVAMPGLKFEFEEGVPEEMLPFWEEDMNFHSTAWFKELWENESAVEKVECKELECCDAAWADWLECDNEYARQDVEMMKAEGGKYFNMILLKALKKPSDARQSLSD